MKIKILIVEDNAILAKDIELRLSDLNYNIIGIADTADKAIDIIQKNRDIDFILLDIMIKGKRDGIELAKEINDKFNIPFIFLTSHADKDLVQRAKKVKPYAYLLKPFNDRQMSIAIELALINFSNKTPEKFLLQKNDFQQKENNILKINDSLFLKNKNRFEKVALDQILFLEADNNYTTIYTNIGNFIYSSVLKKFEELLPIDHFFRIHRSYIVNIKAVNGLEGNMLIISDRKIPVSKSNHKEVFNLFRTV